METDSNIKYFLDFPKKNKLYKHMADNAIDLLINLELLFKNKIRLDFSYHEPDDFILECNNLIRNAVFLVERNKKASEYPWLKKLIAQFLTTNSEDYAILKAVRNSSMHQQFMISKGLSEFGIYKITSPTEYSLKVGMGDFSLQPAIHPSYLYASTTSFFHNILFLHEALFMDIEHSTLNECLGVTRRWVCNVQYKIDGLKKRKDVDIYETVSMFVSDLFLGITESYSKEFEVENESILPLHRPSRYNNINTLLEVDLYPDFFSLQWGGNIKPFNPSCYRDYRLQDQYTRRNEGYLSLIESLPTSTNELKQLLNLYTTIAIEDFNDQEEYNRYVSFITLPHLFTKRFISLGSAAISTLYAIHQLGMEYARNVVVSFATTSNEKKNTYLREIGALIEKLIEELPIPS